MINLNYQINAKRKCDAANRQTVPRLLNLHFHLLTNIFGTLVLCSIFVVMANQDSRGQSDQVQEKVIQEFRLDKDQELRFEVEGNEKVCLSVDGWFRTNSIQTPNVLFF